MPQKIITKTCFVCGKPSKQVQKRSTIHPDSVGPSGVVDLDGRPKELTEFILKNYLEVCPHCGYIAENIEDKTPITRDYLDSPEYQSLCKEKKPISISTFFRAAHIRLGEKNLEKAITYYIFAAWCADLLFLPDLAVSIRKTALSLIFADNRTFADIPSRKWVQVLDILRRCGEFKTVIEQCTSLLAIAGPVLQLGLEFELLCAKKGDREPHTNIDAAHVIQYRLQKKTGKEFIIGGKPYAMEENCYGNGWNWAPDTRTLTLSNYHGTAIEASGDITIRLEQTDNQIHTSYGPGIKVHEGNLVITGLGVLVIQGEDGILVESGTLEMQQSVVEIRTSGFGIISQGTIFLTTTVLEIHADTSPLKSVQGGLTTHLSPVVRIYGERTGIELAGDSSLSAGLYHIESSEGHGILVHHGSLTASDCVIEVISRDTCIWLKSGNLSMNVARFTLSGSSGIEVHGSSSLDSCISTISGENSAISVSKDLKTSGGRFDCSGKTVISVRGNLQIGDTNITASGETCVFAGGDMNITGGILMLTGDTVMQVTRNFEISGGLIMGVGKIQGMIVGGSYSQSGGDIVVSGEARDGMTISGKEMIMTNGALKVSGKRCGLDVAGDMLLLVFSLSASGNTGLCVGKSLKMDKGDFRVTGEEIGLSLKGGNLTVGSTISVTITGNTGIYATKDIEVSGGSLHITGGLGGIIQETGNLTINGGVLDISADEYGILLQSGSMSEYGGIVTVTNSRMMDLGGCGIVISKGNLNAAAILTVRGESYGICVPCGDISLVHVRIMVSGYRTAITGRSLHGESTFSLTAYGKTEGAIVLEQPGFWENNTIQVWAGTSEKSAKDEEYSDQRYVHVYSTNTQGEI